MEILKENNKVNDKEQGTKQVLKEFRRIEIIYKADQ
jgi:hypothetical protein